MGAFPVVSQVAGALICFLQQLLGHLSFYNLHRLAFTCA